MPRLANRRARAEPTPATADTGDSRPAVSSEACAPVLVIAATGAAASTDFGTGACSGVAALLVSFPMQVPGQTLRHPTDGGQPRRP